MKENRKMHIDLRDVESIMVNLTWFCSCFAIAHFFILMAYNIRLISIREFGTVIHEFDPYFNFRATEYLHNHGYKKFFEWYDYRSWYPIGRPIGTTIFPGMQFTATFLKQYIIKDAMSLNDICCYIPAWFGVIASVLVGMIAYECTLECNTKQSVVEVLFDLYRDDEKKNDESSILDDDLLFGIDEKKYDNSRQYQRSKIKKKKAKQHEEDYLGMREDESTKNDGEESNLFLNLSSPSTECGVAATGLMSMVPAHLTRSIGGGFDNECIAMSAMCLTFYLWIRSLRANDDYSHRYGVATGIAYFYMASSWGGYIFVNNLIGLHAIILVLLGRFSSKIYYAYTLFYIIGTILAMQIPIIGTAPLKSLEQLGPLVIFIVYQIIQYGEGVVRKQKMEKMNAWEYRIKMYTMVLLFTTVMMAFFIPDGYFGPISIRIRGLFVEHSKTGNPLVDSVAEHQPAGSSSYFRYLQHLCIFAPIGLLFSLVKFGDASSFAITFAVVAYYFSLKMVRLILLMGPAASILAGIAIGRITTWSLLQLWIYDEEESNESSESESSISKETKKKKKFGKKNISKKGRASIDSSEVKEDSKHGNIWTRILAAILILLLSIFAASFQSYSLKMARVLSNPSIITFGQKSDGSVVKVDDYREAYWWLRDNTPDDARILAWWDYGYQISALANRTTLADGNTWNHEHVALIGKILTTDADEGYNIARHLADYILIWAGGGGDDLAKSPHLAKIANSVYHGHCKEDSSCSNFGYIDRKGTPSLMMQSSLLYQLHSHQSESGVDADPNKFEEVYRSKYGKVKIFKVLYIDERSKSWTSDPRNRKCDSFGSWLCKGQYPPAIEMVINQKQGFKSLKGPRDKEILNLGYQNQYIDNGSKPRRKLKNKMHKKQMKQVQDMNLDQVDIDSVNDQDQADIDSVSKMWQDSEATTNMWKLITTGEVIDLENILDAQPLLAHIRSSDGRGPMFWAFEYRRQDMVKVLMSRGVSHSVRDQSGLTPVDLLDSSPHQKR